MENVNKKNYIILMGISVLCLVALITTATYAYFKPRVEGSGAPLNVSAGKVALRLSESKINVSGVVPILDSTKSTKAQKNTFTVSRTSDSTLNVCYALYLDVESIGSNLKNKYFKWELTYGNGSTVSGNFSGLTYTNGKTSIPLLINQNLSSSVTSNSYTLRLWFSYDTTADQTSLLQGADSTRQFQGKIRATGQSGTC